MADSPINADFDPYKETILLIKLITNVHTDMKINTIATMSFGYLNDNIQRDVIGLQRDIIGLQRDVNGSQRDIIGSQRDVIGL